MSITKPSMKRTNPQRMLLFIFIIMVVIASFIIARHYYFRRSPQTKQHIVVSACNDQQNVQDIINMGGPNKKYWIYNKCGDIHIPTHRVIPLENVGREFHTFVHHIIAHYNTLPESIIFLAATLNKHDRRQRLQHLLELTEDHDFYCDYGSHENQKIKDIFSDWTIDAYDNQQLTPHADPRGFKSWCEHHLGSLVDLNYQWCLNGIFKTSGSRIRKRPVSFYKMLLNQLELGNAPEVLHYMERLVHALFS